MNKDGLGKNITHYRKERGLSQEKLSEYMGVSRQAVTKWENNSSKPSSDNLIKLAELFEVSVAVLLGKEEQRDFTDKTEITTGKIPYCLVGISVLCILSYIMISTRMGVFSMGVLICMFILCIPIQLFLHIYFTNAINNNIFNGIAGFDDKIEYHMEEVKKMLVQINLHIGITSTVYIFLLSAINCMKLEIGWLNGFIIFLYVFDFAAVVITNNYKMTDRIYCNDEDKKRARCSMRITIIYLLLLFIGMGITGFIFEIKEIENNTIHAMQLCGLLLSGVATATVGFMLESRRIKKLDFIPMKYKPNQVSVVSLCLCVIIYVFMIFL